MATTVHNARRVATDGFVGVSRVFWSNDEGEMVEGEVAEYCEFRDRPPAGFTMSLTAEMDVDDDGTVTAGGGPVLADDMGDLVLAIRTPDDMREFEVHEDPPQGWPFREYWLPPEVANQYRDTLQVWVPETEEVVPLGLLEQDHGILITERFGYAMDPPAGYDEAFRRVLADEELTPEQLQILESDVPSKPAGALCVCGDRWRWDGIGGQVAQFDSWSTAHL